MVGEIVRLSDSETEELHELTGDLHSLSRINTSICWQQLQLLWLKEGVVNSKFFHGIRSSRRQGKVLIILLLTAVEGVSEVLIVFSHFATHFKAINVDR